MGPTALFDKSFLQSLHVDESVWFDRFFSANVCPLFYVETLADLEKSNLSNGRTPERLVGIIAEKTPEVSGSPNVHHQHLCISELMGQRTPMTGQIPVAGGRPVNHEGRRGVVFQASPESLAFSRWQQGKFEEVERLHAREWRAMLANLNLPAVAKGVKALGIDSGAVKTLEDAVELARRVINTGTRPFDQMQLAFHFLSIPEDLMRPLLARWSVDGYRPLSQYAPYVAHVLTVEIFFQVALGAGLISAERASNRADIAYLFYLPFCNIFISSDKLHRRCAPLFLGAGREFVWGPDLKIDLRRLNDHYAQLPEQEREKGILHFANWPTGSDDDLVVALWNRHLPGWSSIKESTAPMRSDSEKELVSRIKAMQNAPTVEPPVPSSEEDEVSELSIERFVLRKKGNWYQMPKDLQADPEEGRSTRRPSEM